MFNKVKRYIKDPYRAFGYDLIKSHPHWMSDKYYLSILWEAKMGYPIDWKHPKSFNEKLQWIKVYDRNPLYTTLVDKYRMKQWVADLIGEDFIIPTLSVYDSVDKINSDRLPDKYVLKCNHDSGSVFICRDKFTFDLEDAKRKLNNALQKNFYWEAREWPYKNVKRCVFVEPFLGSDLQDYRIYCFNGEPKVIYSYTNVSELDGSKPEPSYCNIYDTSWEPLPFHQKSLPREIVPPPRFLGKMLELAARLSKGIPFVRIDFFEESQIFVGEMTFFPGGGMSRFVPANWDFILGDWIKLPF